MATHSSVLAWIILHIVVCICGEGNGNPLQCTCLENPRDGGAWCAAVYVVAQSWTRLKQLSSSSRQLYPGFHSVNRVSGGLRSPGHVDCDFTVKDNIIVIQWGPEYWKIDAFKLWYGRRLLSHLDSKDIKPVNPKGNQHWIFTGRSDAEALILQPPDAKSQLIGKDP